MRRNILGRTGLQISEIALGGGVTGGVLLQPVEVRRLAALERAISAGINWIDTAPLYGNGVSEETIGRYLPALKPRPSISTKVRIEPEQMSDLAGAIERSLEQSLKRLRVDRVELFQLHNQLGEAVGDRPALSPERVLRRGGVADIFDRLKEQGLFLASGVTAAGDTHACLEVIESGRFDTAQIYFNAINPSAAWSRVGKAWTMQDFSGIIAACWRQNMGMLNIRIWAGGPLASAARPERLAVFASGTDLDNEVRCAAAIHAKLGNAYGTPAQTALRFVLGHKDLSTRLIGVANIQQLEEALKAVEAGPLPSEAMAKLKALWATNFRY